MADCDPLARIPDAFLETRIILSAVELGVFDAIGARAIDAGGIAAEIGAHPEALRRLLDALVAIGVLRKRGDRYRMTPAARRQLVRGATDSMADMFRHYARMWESWSRLTHVVRTGRAPRRRRDRESQEAFSRAMADLARRSARETLRAIDLRGVRRMLDVGGAPGIYAVVFARARPSLRATVLDRPEAGPLTRRVVREAGLADRIRFRGGDITRLASLGSGYDLVLVSNVIHVFRPPAVRALLGKVARAVRPGGRAAIKDFVLDPDRAGPRFPAIFSINMLVAAAGDCYTRAELEAWLAEAGLGAFRWRPVAENSMLAVATRPARAQARRARGR